MPSKDAGRHERLKKRIQDVYNSDWPRFMDRYNEIYESVSHDSGSSDFDIDSKLAQKCRKDIENDGPEFMETQDGIASRINPWLDEIIAGV